MAKVTYNDVRTLQDTIATTGYASDYVLGAYGVMIAEMISEMPASKQKAYMEDLKNLKQRVDLLADVWV